MQAMLHVLVDWLLIATAPSHAAIVLTKGSSFGAVAAAVAGAPRVYLLSVDQESTGICVERSLEHAICSVGFYLQPALDLCASQL